MPEPWWRADPQDLQRVAERLSTIYVEHCTLDREDNAVVLAAGDQSVRLPAAMLAAVLLGPGTRITHAAVTLLADSGTTACWVGEHGVRMYAAGVGTSRGTQLLLRQAWLVTRPRERLAVARRMYAMRFPGEDISGLTMQQLRGREGARIRGIYRDHSERTGVPWRRREYRHGAPFAAGDDVNRLLSAAHASLYGLCHAGIVSIGASPALGFIHTGSATSFVMDVADLYKADYTIPLAFDLAASGHLSERAARLAFRDQVADGKLLHQIVRDVKELLAPEMANLEDVEANTLWDDELGVVSGGLNWDGADPLAETPKPRSRSDDSDAPTGRRPSS